MYRSNPWASDWLKGYDKEGLEGLKDRTKSGRPPKLSKETSYQIKQELKQSNHQGWTTKQVEELIIKKSSIKYHSIHIYRILRKWGFKQKKVPRKVHVNTASTEEKEIFKKRLPKYLLWISNSNSKKHLP
ncbi:MAG: helix-turn-helix domain-containing protein [Candidatus Nitrosocosmicus sp.]